MFNKLDYLESFRPLRDTNKDVIPNTQKQIVYFSICLLYYLQIMQ